jgi:hypothetical protein
MSAPLSGELSTGVSKPSLRANGARIRATRWLAMTEAAPPMVVVLFISRHLQTQLRDLAA